MKPIALAIADLHINDWKEAYSYKGNRLSHSLHPLDVIGQRARKLEIPILFCGDLFHKPKTLDNRVFEYFVRYYKTALECFGVKFLAISGNHDQSEKNTFEHNSPSYVKTFSNLLRGFDCIDGTFRVEKEFVVAGIPYLTGNNGFDKYLKQINGHLRNNKLFKILLIHTDLPGAKNGFGFEIGEVKNIPRDMDKYFRAFDLVLSGHIHKPQQLSRNVYMLGAPGHQNAGDTGIEMGYWEIYKEGKPKFVKLDLPEYRYINEGDKIPDDFHIYMPVKKGNKGSVVVLNSKFNNKMSKTKLAKNYCKTKGIKQKSKKKALISTLRES